METKQEKVQTEEINEEGKNKPVSQWKVGAFNVAKWKNKSKFSDEEYYTYSLTKSRLVEVEGKEGEWVKETINFSEKQLSSISKAIFKAFLE